MCHIATAASKQRPIHRIIGVEDVVVVQRLECLQAVLIHRTRAGNRGIVFRHGLGDVVNDPVIVQIVHQDGVVLVDPARVLDKVVVVHVERRVRVRIGDQLDPVPFFVQNL